RGAGEERAGAVVELGAGEPSSRDGLWPGLPAETRRAEEVHQRVVHALAHLAPEELDEARLGPERLAAGEARERSPVVEARDLDLDPVLGETLTEDGIPGAGWTAVTALTREAEEVLEAHAVAVGLTG